MLDEIITEGILEIITDVEPDSFRQKEVLVTGGAGFLGSWLCESLIKLEAKVTVLDDLSSGKMEHLGGLQKSERFKFIRGNTVSTDISGIYDLIFHFASPASPDDYQRRPIDTMLANSMGALNMLRIAERNSCPIVFASTSEIYGDAEVIPTPETYWGKVNPIGPRSSYDESKRFAEALGVAFRTQKSMDVRVARLFNSYGPRLRPDGAYARAVSRFLFQALNGEPITVYGDGSQTRSFCYVTDTIGGILKVATSDAARNETFNVGNPKEVKIIDLARTIKGLTRSSSEIAFRPLPIDDPRRRCPDISKARRILNWEPKVDLRTGLIKTFEWIKVNYPVKAKANK